MRPTTQVSGIGSLSLLFKQYRLKFIISNQKEESICIVYAI